LSVCIRFSANPGLLGGRSDFQERYVGRSLRRRSVAASSPARQDPPVRPPPRKRESARACRRCTDADLHVELDYSERSVYDAVRVARGSISRPISAMRHPPRRARGAPPLRQAASTRSSSRVRRATKSLRSSARREARGVIADGHKARVFSQFDHLLDLGEPTCRMQASLQPASTGRHRDRARWSPGSRTRRPAGVLVSLKAGGTGLNLRRRSLFCSSRWHPAVEDQAAARAHRNRGTDLAGHGSTSLWRRITFEEYRQAPEKNGPSPTWPGPTPASRRIHREELPCAALVRIDNRPRGPSTLPT